MMTNNRWMKSKHGFTLAETLAAILIMSMVGLIIVGGFTTFKTSYDVISTQANAQLLMSSAEAKIRNELEYSTGVNIQADDQLVLSYQDGQTGMWKDFDNDGEIGLQALVSDTYEMAGAEKEKLLNKASAPGGMTVTVGQIYYFNGVYEIHDLTVWAKGGSSLIAISRLRFRCLNEDAMEVHES